MRFTRDKDTWTLEDGTPYEEFHTIAGHQLVKVVNICDWLDNTYGDDFMSHPDYETTRTSLMEWCKDNNAHYYARDRESYSTYEAIHEAIEKGNKVVVVEDLS